MTKAEAYVHNSPRWEKTDSRTEDHGSMADTTVNIYHRFEEGNPEPTHRLTCYSSHGDSILWVASTIENVQPRYKWELARGTWMMHTVTDGNIEFVYDHALKDLV